VKLIANLEKYMNNILKALIAAALIVSPLGLKDASAQFFFTQNPLIGKPAPEFTLDLVKGGQKTLSEYRDGKSAVVFFWATWCPHCRVELKGLNTKAPELEQKGIKVVLVDIEESAPEVQAYLDKNKIGYDVFLDKDLSVSEDYGIIGVPTFFFVGGDGLVKAVEHSLPRNYEEILKRK
jgi:peroxiredoxin